LAPLFLCSKCGLVDFCNPCFWGKNSVCLFYVTLDFGLIMGVVARLWRGVVSVGEAGWWRALVARWLVLSEAAMRVIQCFAGAKHRRKYEQTELEATTVSCACSFVGNFEASIFEDGEV